MGVAHRAGHTDNAFETMPAPSIDMQIRQVRRCEYVVTKDVPLGRSWLSQQP